ncbi:MAG: ABC transporter substrate-binding protein, partial [Candidatus Sericytochromatia bacterium]|nr:ABC transporter substrate-binding protein [Candidatus Sericytochromatia bacterium]
MRRSRLVLSVLAGMLLVSCATPRHRGSVFVFAKAKDAVKLDPADIIDGESATVTNNIFESLVQFAPESTEIVPALATHWEITPDGKTYTFHLRPNVRFHDGTPCDADAIVFNYQRQMDPQSPYRFTAHFEYWANFFKAVDSVKAAGKDTVVMHLSAPDATFMTNMALFTMGIASPKAIKDFGQDVGL